MELIVPKGQKDTIKAHAAAKGESVNGFIGRVISEAMERDSGGAALEAAGKGLESTQGGGVALPSETLETAQRAAERAGEAVADFMRRAVAAQSQRDQASLKLGINPATGAKLGSDQE